LYGDCIVVIRTSPWRWLDYWPKHCWWEYCK